MARIIQDDDVLDIVARHTEGTSAEVRRVLQDIVSDMKRLPARSMATGIPLWDFKNNFAPRELLWLRDQYDGRIVAKGWRYLRRYRDVTVTGVYPSLSVEDDGSTARSVLVCWGNHEEIVSVSE